MHCLSGLYCVSDVSIVYILWDCMSAYELVQMYQKMYLLLYPLFYQVIYCENLKEQEQVSCVAVK